ncbi:hypothetical protein Csp2054_08490 [Curtobacterium sp. 'Ferrero']|uniref:hypothetical protein n=1 Tax=Curtobacterium sp. 'Ferrero' TaxID=2033654 RepID=UPI000BC459A2|nr:hypothetical protein [Curtobacterium sp. 'Ferrero']PCN48184.1 hypothetical protein Csp2054_08490 [Curtobacterium sp. 'Ferrero']
MKHIVYGLTAVLTTDEAADAVLDYAAALAHAGLSDVVAVPTVDPFGTQTTTSFLLAPALGVLVEDAPDDPLGPDTESFVAEISWRAQAVRSAPPDAAH